MPRTAAQNAIIRDKRKTKILMKTLKIFACVGFDEVTIDDISNESNCSHGLIYHYFEKKDDIFNELMRVQKEEFPKSIFPEEEALNAGGKEGLKLVCEYYENLKNLSKNDLFFAKITANRDYFTNSATKTLDGKSPYSTLVTLFKDAGFDNAESKARLFLDLVVGLLSRYINGKEKQREVSPNSLFDFVF